MGRWRCREGRKGGCGSRDREAGGQSDAMSSRQPQAIRGQGSWVH